MSVAQDHPKTISDTLTRIIDMSVDTYYNPYKMFEWPETLPDEQWWMTQELMSTYGTRYHEELTEQQLQVLSKWESVHFYSLNVHGIRELLIEVVKRVHQPGFEVESEFFHHFIGEENEHMWFFAKFCLNYGKKIYPDRKMSFQIEENEADIESFLVFSRVLIFEELVDYVNLRMGRDESLHPIIRQVNSIHHQDESRHIAFGRELVKQLWDRLTPKYSAETLKHIEDYLKRYMTASVQSLYNPAIYKDAGLPDPYKMRTDLLADPARRPYNNKILKRSIDFYTKKGIIHDGDFL